MLRSQGVRVTGLLTVSVVLVTSLVFLFLNLDAAAPAWASGIIATATLVAAVGAVWAAALEGQGMRESRDQHTKTMVQEQRLRTLEYCSGQLERDAVLDARALVDRMDQVDSEAYYGHLQAEQDEDLMESIRQLAHSCNRIGAGVAHDALDADMISTIWPQGWFRKQWAATEALLQVRGKDIERRYPYFQGLAGVALIPARHPDP